MCPCYSRKSCYNHGALPASPPDQENTPPISGETGGPARLVTRLPSEGNHDLPSERRTSLPYRPVPGDLTHASSPLKDQQPRGDLVDKEAVVADHDDRAGKVHQRTLHHLGAGQIQVIRRLVQQDNRRPREQALCQRCPRPPLK